MMRHLIRTKNRGIEYDEGSVGSRSKTLIAFSDASFADDSETSFSSSGFVSNYLEV